MLFCAVYISWNYYYESVYCPILPYSSVCSKKQEALEESLYNSTLDCIGRSCPSAECVLEFVGKFPSSPRIEILRTRAAQADASPRCNRPPTRSKLPIAIIKENDYDSDQNVVDDLSQTLSDEGLNITTDVSKAAVLIEISNVKTDSSGSGKSIDGSMFERYDGTASFKLKMVWVGVNTLTTEQPFYGSGSGGKESAKAAALVDARIKAKEFVASITNRK